MFVKEKPDRKKKCTTFLNHAVKKKFRKKVFVKTMKQFVQKISTTGREARLVRLGDKEIERLNDCIYC